MNSSLIVDSLEAVHASILENEADIESLDRAIGDGDHYLNIRRGCTTLMAMRAELGRMLPSVALQAMGMKLLSTIGGASGPLISSFFTAMGASLSGKPEPARQDIAEAFAAGVDAIKRRGKADVGEKTMLDVLIPVSRLLTKLVSEDMPLDEICRQLNAEATRNMVATRDMIATKGRAYSLGERALGHIDPGCKTCEVIIAAVTATTLSQ
ncbi:dihydroxyacetone kinase subunit DhaL [Variovorax terrae]|uniref:Dihydroxyacetone kinase subunit L n=1 Tax=Variovorax terrae TaxID=2923278 RepID=A0A9X1VRW9_9BURK|nr:dihydroxyacetone kinase subunit DhaL [Variovorax terrae]MCJ0762265.1 dihydroxyacetone kinase subunit L [Variovorax terrae]